MNPAGCKEGPAEDCFQRKGGRGRGPHVVAGVHLLCRGAGGAGGARPPAAGEAPPLPPLPPPRPPSTNTSPHVMTLHWRNGTLQVQGREGAREKKITGVRHCKFGAARERVV